jgi:hypothetical protein
VEVNRAAPSTDNLATLPPGFSKDVTATIGRFLNATRKAPEPKRNTTWLESLTLPQRRAFENPVRDEALLTTYFRDPLLSFRNGQYLTTVLVVARDDGASYWVAACEFHHRQRFNGPNRGRHIRPKLEPRALRALKKVGWEASEQINFDESAMRLVLMRPLLAEEQHRLKAVSDVA